MLLPKPTKKENLFLVEFALWQCVVAAEEPEEAATLAFEEVLEKYKSNTEVSPVFTVLNISMSMDKMDIGDNLTFVYSPTVLANAGMHKTSKELQSIIENLKSNER
tara:strand:- start:1069 stop:1386 length:318 start_codon:yes stop_codon:yes gene_type:complete